MTIHITPSEPYPVSNVTEYNDYASIGFVGQVGMEESLNIHDPKLYEVTGIDRDKWNIVGFDVTPANARWEDEKVTVFVTPAQKPDDPDFKLGKNAYAENLEVHAVDVEGLRLQDILSCMKSARLLIKGGTLANTQFIRVGEATITEP